MEEKFYAIVDAMNKYFSEHEIQDVVIGNSGGIDSALCIAILKRCNVRIHSRYIHIDSNKPEERERAHNIANAFHVFTHKEVDFTSQYKSLANSIILSENKIEEDTSGAFFNKVQLGNIKARLRMIYLYNLASQNSGIVCSTDNKTEYLLGFWTLHGDVGDITPLYELYKTEVYKMAEFLLTEEDEFMQEVQEGKFSRRGKLSTSEYNALKACILATPTDGLGITNSDLDQLNAANYGEVDLSLLVYEKTGSIINEDVIQRHINSSFKRNNPFNIITGE